MTLPTTEPTSIRAGDTWAWQITLSEYDGYALTYFLRNATAKIDVATTASGATFTVGVAASTTATYKPGRYKWIRRVTGAGGTFTAGEGVLEVLPNLGGDYTQETRSSARVRLDMIDAYLADENNLTAASYSIGGRSLSRWSRAELIAERSQLDAMVKREERADKLARGERLPRLQVRF